MRRQRITRAFAWKLRISTIIDPRKHIRQKKGRLSAKRLGRGGLSEYKLSHAKEYTDHLWTKTKRWPPKNPQEELTDEEICLWPDVTRNSDSPYIHSPPWVLTECSKQYEDPHACARCTWMLRLIWMKMMLQFCSNQQHFKDSESRVLHVLRSSHGRSFWPAFKAENVFDRVEVTWPMAAASYVACGPILWQEYSRTEQLDRFDFATWTLVVFIASVGLMGHR